ncbi:HalOD1 output domain-containing protein [Saliphagus sp. LR7]|uniref:HalOD1 output domain-containing protein n=1 Tax=Saliphagus sp. LR7 TaxID=2282654 RepID=UPI000DF7E049|nr:HalOD1 output domain-containing protein [Saliphagus sp. LR7]
MTRIITDGGTDRDHTLPASLTYEISADERLSEALVKAVGIATEQSVLDLDPLYDTIDPGHIDGLFDNTEGKASPELVFEYNGCTVTTTRERIEVERSDDTA